jgi:acetyl-CoA decarbonylase/synthase complex subunit delta
MMRMPMLVTPGSESALCKESWASEQDVPEWGREDMRTAYWEITTAISLLLAGGELLIMYHPKAVEMIKRKTEQLSSAIGVD